jgi:Zn-dependent metalloprotease
MRVALVCGLCALAVPSGTAIASDGFADGLGPGVDVSRQDESGTVGFIGTAPGRSLPSGLAASAPSRAAAKAFVTRYPAQFGVGGAADGVRIADVQPSVGEGKSVRLQQVHRGVPVLGGELVVSLDSDNGIRSLLGETSPSPDLSVDPAVSRDDAAATAAAAVAKVHGVFPSDVAPSSPKLHVYDPRLLGAPDPLGEARLAWVLEVTGLGSEPIRELVVVDAETGGVALHFNQIAEALDREVCNANNATAQVPCVAPVRTEGGPPVANDNDDVNLAYDFAGDTYDFFAQFGRDSLDDNGMTLISTVDYCEPGTCPNYSNAFWNGEQMVYGEGFAAADDVVGHELGHGVTDFSSHLFYYYQSGAINESMSDVFGELVDLTNGAGTDTAAVRWLLGEDVPGFGAIRDMQDPAAFSDPDRMTSPNYVADVNNDVTGTGDSGGVHTNSGVNNKTAYLITDGDTFNGHTITGIGIPKTSRIYYEVNNAMLGSASDYADLANALPQACTNLIGTSGITAADCTQVAEAVAATEMATDPPAAPTANAPTCPTGTFPSFVFNDNLENPASGNWASSAAVGSNNWFYPQNSNPFGFDATYAASGDTNFWGVNDSPTSDSSIAMTSSAAIPANAFIRFDHAFGFEDDPGNGTRWDGGVIEYSTDDGATWTDAGSLIDGGLAYNGTITTSDTNPLGGRQAFTSESNGYGASRLDLSSLSGQNVRFRFRLGADSAFIDYGWFIDDVRIYACAAPPPPPPPDGGAVPPDNLFTLGKVKGKSLTVTVPGPGEVEVRDAADRSARRAPAAGAKAKKKLLKPSSATATQAGSLKVKLKLTKTAKKVIKKKGKVKVKAAITFTPTGGTSNRQTKRLKVKK